MKVISGPILPLSHYTVLCMVRSLWRLSIIRAQCYGRENVSKSILCKVLRSGSYTSFFRGVVNAVQQPGRLTHLPHLVVIPNAATQGCSVLLDVLRHCPLCSRSINAGIPAVLSRDAQGKAGAVCAFFPFLGHLHWGRHNLASNLKVLLPSPSKNFLHRYVFCWISVVWPKRQRNWILSEMAAN